MKETNKQAMTISEVLHSSMLGGSWNNSMSGRSGGMGYSPIKFHCMNCGYEHKENACPKCGSKAVRVG
jgi:rubrerythrin